MSFALRTRIPALLSFALALGAAPNALADCADGVVDGIETCDDANLVSGDGCAAICQYEAGFRCSGSPSLCCFEASASGFDLIGSASVDPLTSEVTVTPQEAQQSGYAWFRRPLDFSADFSLNLRLYLGSEDAGADGGAILFQRDPRGLLAVGSPGGDLGAVGIDPVLGVEFDTFSNGAQYGDVADDHTSIFVGAPGGATALEGQRTAAVCLNDDCDDFEDGRYHFFEIGWTAATTTMTVMVDGSERLTLSEDLVTNYFDGDPTAILFGVAASTGFAHNLQKFCPLAPSGFTTPSDTDGDGVDDAEDLDDDNDGIADLEESRDLLPSDPSGDHDTDGIKNFRDPDYWNDVVEEPANCPDVIAPIGECDGTPTGIDQDGDGRPNHLDHDSDGDGLTDASETLGVDQDGDGVLDDCGAVDADGVCEGGLVLAPVDSDGDGDPDYLDDDDDDDTVGTETECAGASVCPDSDGDGTPDQLDEDSDNDGHPDGADTSPGSPCTPSPQAIACPSGDSDADGVSNGVECVAGFACPDTDNDGDVDPLDRDSDNDGVDDRDDDARLDATVCADTDGDGCSDCRLTGADESGGDPLADGEDTDGDGSCNEGDADNDDDGVEDESDTSPENARLCRDIDLDACDDCTNTGPNESGGDVDDDGLDSDGDRQCDETDEDDDDDGVVDAADGVATDPNRCRDVDADSCDDCTRTGADQSGGDPQDDGEDADADGRCNIGETDIDGDGVLDPFDADADNDGIPNLLEGLADFDGDEVANFIDLDSDADGLTDLEEQGFGALDGDGSGRLDDASDDDGDGLANGVDSAPTDPNDATLAGVALDSDMDGDHDRVDLDSDDDGASDLEERYDGDEDGRPDIAASGEDDDDDGLDDSFDLDQGGVRPQPPNTDDDETPNFLDDDDDGDGLLTTHEDLDHNADLVDDDTDGDDHPNFLDHDDDGDGQSTRAEGADPNGDGDPSDALDLDDDGTDDYLDPIVDEPPGAGGAGGAAGLGGVGAEAGSLGTAGIPGTSGGEAGEGPGGFGGESGSSSSGAGGVPAAMGGEGGATVDGVGGEAGARDTPVRPDSERSSLVGGGFSCSLPRATTHKDASALCLVWLALSLAWSRRRSRRGHASTDRV